MEHRTINELITLYTLEPNLRDLYVEGTSDKKFFEWFFNNLGCDTINIFEINTIDIENSLINNYSLSSGNRDRVIVLSLEFRRFLNKNIKYLLCIADSEFDFLLGRKYNSRYLLYTDYTSLDLYFFSEYILEKLFMLGVSKVPCNIKSLFSNLSEILQEVFLIRSVNVKLGWNLHWVCFTNNCRIENKIIKFDRNKFIEKYLNSNGRLGDRDKFNEVYEKLSNIKVETFKQRIRGHDYLKLMGWYISKIVGRGGNKYRDINVIRSLIITSVDKKSLLKEKLFQKLLKKYEN